MKHINHVHNIFSGADNDRLSKRETLSVFLGVVGFTTFVIWALCPVRFGLMTLLYAYCKANGLV